jgi:BirA family transcriptional regulator, biotin operon repressor / biotin---[acetyl-CoA-carboxylase] ligase
MTELLDHATLWNALSPELRSQLRLEIFPELDSTNQYALNSPASCLACLAEYQTQGRGRQGKQWISPVSSGLCLSLKYCYPATVFPLVGLNLALAVTVAKLLRNLGASEVGVKWPNDIGWKSRKLAGLLLETRLTTNRYEVVLGIGLNIEMPKTVAIDQAWVDLQTVMGHSISRNTVASLLIEQGIQTLKNYPTTHFTPFLAEWEEFDLLKSKQIQVSMPTKTDVGIAFGIDESGALRLQVGETQQLVYYGEASVCLAK